MKVWKDASEIEMIHELPNEKLRQLDRVMTTKPNFNKVNEIKKYKKNKKQNRKK